MIMLLPGRIHCGLKDDFFWYRPEVEFLPRGVGENKFFHLIIFSEAFARGGKGFLDLGVRWSKKFVGDDIADVAGGLV